MDDDALIYWPFLHVELMGNESKNSVPLPDNILVNTSGSFWLKKNASGDPILTEYSDVVWKLWTDLRFQSE